MKIETKYDIGQHIWVVYEYQEEICIYDDYITEVIMPKDGTVKYMSEKCDDTFKEEEIILYEDANKLVESIKEMLKEVSKGKKDER